jgi:rRNA-processing protein EBP2
VNQPLDFFVQIALRRIRETFQLDPSIPWTETLTVSYPETIDVDVEDDLNRELALCVVSRPAYPY